MTAVTVEEVLGLAPAVWDALATIVTAAGVVTAGVAAVIALRQYKSSEASRRDQTRPYVIVSVQPNAAGEEFMDLVIENVGTTAAHDVQVNIDPPFELSRQDQLPPQHRLNNARVFTEPIPMIPPHHALRMFLDSAIERSDEGSFRDRYDAHLHYTDGRGGMWEEVCKLDLGLRAGMTYIQTFGVHHAAKALREIEKSVKKVAQSAGQVEATIETRVERDERRAAIRREREEMLERFEQQQRAAREGQSSSSAIETGLSSDGG